MHNLLVVFFSFLAGNLCRNWGRFPHSTGQALNAFVIGVSLPALILIKIPRIIDGSEAVYLGWVPVLFMWAMFFTCWLIIAFIGKKMNWPPQKTGALILTTGLANTSFVGLPLLKATLGDAAIPYAILADQPGEFLIVSTLGILVAVLYSGTQVKAEYIFKRVLSFPPFVALFISLIFAWLGIHKLEMINSSLEILANTLVPLALFAVGYQSVFKFSILRRRLGPLMIGLSLRMIIIPFLFFMLISNFESKPFSMPWLVTILESAMATQITSALVASEFHLDSELANLMVTISVPISLISIPLWSSILN